MCGEVRSSPDCSVAGFLHPGFQFPIASLWTHVQWRRLRFSLQHNTDHLSIGLTNWRWKERKFRNTNLAQRLLHPEKKRLPGEEQCRRFDNNPRENIRTPFSELLWTFSMCTFPCEKTVFHFLVDIHVLWDRTNGGQTDVVVLGMVVHGGKGWVGQGVAVHGLRSSTAGVLFPVPPSTLPQRTNRIPLSAFNTALSNR